MIVTVVATGFDASYFGERNDENAKSDSGVLAGTTTTTPSSAMSDIDMSLDETKEDEHSFTDDSHVPNMWTIDDKDDDESKDTKNSDVFVGDVTDDELEKPSFLRRITRRNKDDDSTENKE